MFLFLAHKSRSVFVQSKLPLTTLTKIWKLLDKSENDEFSLTEFSTCLRLMQAAICGMKIPDTLPNTLQHGRHCKSITIPEITKERAQAYEFIYFWLKPGPDGMLTGLKTRRWKAFVI